MRSFAALPENKREQMLFLLATCNDNAPRRLAATVRNFYIEKVMARCRSNLRE